MITIYKVIDEKRTWIEIDINVNGKDRQIECTGLEIGIKFQKNSKNFLLQITQEDLENLNLCESISSISLDRKDREKFLIKLNNYRQDRKSADLNNKLSNILYKSVDNKKLSFNRISEICINFADKLYQNIGFLATDNKGVKLKEMLLDFMNNPDDYIQPRPRKITYSTSKKDIEKILKKYTQDESIIDEFLSYFI